jgi:acetolactate synthase-1/2/3 large subunit
MVSQGMEHFFPDTKDPDVWGHLYRLGDADLVKFAEGLGADAYAVSSPAELREVMPGVLKKANDEGRPQVVVAQINPKRVPPYYLPDYTTPPATIKPSRAVL